MHAPLTTDQLTTALDQLHGAGNAIKLEFLRVLDHLDRNEGWREDGATSLTNWVSYRYALTWNAAFEHVRTMLALRDLPAIASAFGTGSISWEVLVMLCTFVQPHEDDEWSDRASRISAAEVRNHARKARRLSREDAARNHARRFLWTSWSTDGDFLRLNGMIPGAEGAMVKKTLDRIADQLGPGPDGIFANAEQRRADALVELVGTHVAQDGDPDRANIVVHVEARELARPDGNAIVEDGPTLPIEVVRRLMCDARIEVVVHGPDGAPITIGTVSRSVPAKIRRQLFERDKGCVLCQRTEGCHAHHVRHWFHGGKTRLNNLVRLCRTCHRTVHDGGFRVARDQFGIVKLIKPDGRPVRNRPTPLRPEVRERLLGPSRLASTMRC